MVFGFLHELAIVSIIKNEAPYLREWLDYHIAAGITHFYLYDNESIDHTQTLLRPYMEQGYVTYHFFPGKCAQMPAYNDAIRRYRFSARYLALIDADEFIYPLNGKSIPQAVQDILNRYPEAGGLTMNWRIFGSAGQKKADLSRGVLERFCWRSKDEFGPNQHVKSIINPRCVRYVPNPHFALYMYGKCAVDERGKNVPDYKNEDYPMQELCVNHYFTKSEQEWIARRSIGTADGTTGRRREEFFNHDQNVVHDTGILSYYQARQGCTSVPDDQQIYFVRTIDECQTFLLQTGISNMETALGYFHIMHHVSHGYLNATDYASLEQEILQRLMCSMDRSGLSFAEVQLLVAMLPELLESVGKLKHAFLEAVRHLLNRAMQGCKKRYLWSNYYELYYLQELLCRWE